MNIGDTPDLGGGEGVILGLSFLVFGALISTLGPIHCSLMGKVKIRIKLLKNNHRRL